jgi:3-deoxy-D-manno-octulosonic-acid transferase
VITGPHTANSKDIARRLIERGGAVEVADPQALAAAVRRLLQDPGARERAVRSARDFIAEHRGAVERLAALIDPLIRGPDFAPAANRSAGDSGS